jgi:acetolactate synthase-1/3 small subunit
VSATEKERSELFQLTEVFHGRIVDITIHCITIEVSASPHKIDAFIAVLVPYGIKELARTGRIALARG